MSDYPSPDIYSMPSTGDLERDRIKMERFIISEKRQIEGICPNGCAPMMLDDPYTRHCPKCNFTGHSNVPFPAITPTLRECGGLLSTDDRIGQSAPLAPESVFSPMSRVSAPEDDGKMITCCSLLPQRMVRVRFTWGIFPIYFTQAEFAEFMEDAVEFFRKRSVRINEEGLP